MTNTTQGPKAVGGSVDDTGVEPGRKTWVAPEVIVSVIARDTAAKTSSGFGFETHSPGSLNGS
ncbi:MAG: hypothetical protein WDM91_22170 [Rhizomicrobium sp.]